MADIYGGKVFGLFDPLRVSQDSQAITVEGTTFALTISKLNGQLVSAKVEGTQYIAPGSSLPSPYIGVMPPDEPGARKEGGKDRPRFGHELACEIFPTLFSGELTMSHRHDAIGKPADAVEVVSAEADRVVIRSRGRYGETAVRWEVQYDIDVDGMTKVTVRAIADKPLMLRWHCFNHTTIAPQGVDFLVPWMDVGLSDVTGFGPMPAQPMKDVKEGSLVLGSHLNPFFHMGNTQTGIEFSKQDFADRHSGYRDSSALLEDGRKIEFGTVKTADGKEIYSGDSRGWRRHFTQMYRRGDGYELEEFDIRNTTIPMNPGQQRERTFWFQLTPCRHSRNDLNTLRVTWPGPHQVQMVRWVGRTTPWAPPSDEQVKLWAQMGYNLIVGGSDCFSGDYMHPMESEKVRHYIETAHSYGMKVIPYVTFSDFNFAAPGYQEHALEWMASADIEYRGETTLMCFGAEGWRNHFEKQIDSLLGNFDFDGLYIDHWGNTRPCNNARHGCGGYMMRFIVEGYHDIAKRARRVVARHTNGQGIMLVNSGDDIFSGVLSWFDLRLVGENIDPRKVPAMTIRSSYDPDRQGIATVAYPSRYKMDASFLNFVVSHMFSVRLSAELSLEQWQDSCPGQPWDGYKRYWDIWRYFNLNAAKRISAFRSAAVAKVSHGDARVTLYLKDGRILAVLGVVKLIDLAANMNMVDQAVRDVEAALKTAGLSPVLAEDLAGELRPHIRPGGAAASANTVESAIRAGFGGDTAVDMTTWDDCLELTDLPALGLNNGGQYVVQDLLNHCYIDVKDISRVPVRLHASQPQVLLIEPRQASPRVAHFTGADAVNVKVGQGEMTFDVSAVEGSPVSLYLDAGEKAVAAQTPGFTASKLAGGMVQVSGYLPASRKITIKIG